MLRLQTFPPEGLKQYLNLPDECWVNDDKIILPDGDRIIIKSGYSYRASLIKDFIMRDFTTRGSLYQKIKEVCKDRKNNKLVKTEISKDRYSYFAKVITDLWKPHISDKKTHQTVSNYLINTNDLISQKGGDFVDCWHNVDLKLRDRCDRKIVIWEMGIDHDFFDLDNPLSHVIIIALGFRDDNRRIALRLYETGKIELVSSLVGFGYKEPLEIIDYSAIYHLEGIDRNDVDLDCVIDDLCYEIRC